MSELFFFQPEEARALEKMVSAAIALGARNSKRVIAIIREEGLTDEEVTDDQLRPLVQSILKDKGLFRAKKKVEISQINNISPEKTIEMRGHVLQGTRHFFQSLITPTAHAVKALGQILVFIFCVLFLFVFYRFSQNGRYQTSYNGVIIDTRTGAVYKGVRSSTELQLLHNPVSDEE